MHISISWFGVLFITLLLLAAGVAVIKLLSILGNAILGRKPEVPVPVQKINTEATPRKSFPFLMVFGIVAVVVLLSFRANVRVSSSQVEFPVADSTNFVSTNTDAFPRPSIERALKTASDNIKSDLSRADGDVERGLLDALSEIDHAKKQVRDALRSESGDLSSAEETVLKVTSDLIAKGGAAVKNINSGETKTASSAEDFVVMRLSPAALAELVGEKRLEVLKALRERLPGQPQHTFALIQLSAPGAENAAPAIAPLVVAEKITNIAVSFADIVEEEKLKDKNAATAATPGSEPPAPATAETPATEATTATTVADTAATDATTTDPAVTDPAVTAQAGTAEAADAEAAAGAASPEGPATPATAAVDSLAEVASAEFTTVAPAWLKETPPGKMHVKTSFFPAGETGEQELKEVIRKSIQEELGTMDSKYLRPEFLHHLLAIKVDDNVVDACVAGELKYEEQEPVTTGAGTLTMKRIHALVSIPEEVRQNAQQQVEAAIRQNRADVLALSMGMVWCAVVAGAIGVKVGRKSRLMRYLISAPLILLVGIPLLTGSVGVVTASASGQYVSVPWNEGPIVVQLTEIPSAEASH